MFVANTPLLTEYGPLDFSIFTPLGSTKEHIVISIGQVRRQEKVVTRIHSECLTSEVFHSQECDCAGQLDSFLDLISSSNEGILIYLRQEGRGIGLTEKIRAYALQDRLGLNTLEANTALGHPQDSRSYDVAADILDQLGVSSICLVTNSPDKEQQLLQAGVKIDEIIPTPIHMKKKNVDYLNTKRIALRHRIPKLSPNDKEAVLRNHKHIEKTDAGVSLNWPISAFIYEGKTELGQDLSISHNEFCGWAMMLNGQLQNCALDDEYYHEILTHVPLVADQTAKDILVVGGASGAILREVLKHKQTNIEVVEIDPGIPEICRKSLAWIHKNYDDERVQLTIADINEFSKISTRMFDLIFLDIPDFGQDGPVAGISFREIVRGLKKSLRPDGLILCQTSVPFFGNEYILRTVIEDLESMEMPHKFFGTLSPMFPGGFQTFTAVGEQKAVDNLIAGNIAEKFKSAQIECKFYNADVHLASFAFAEAVIQQRLK